MKGLVVALVAIVLCALCVPAKACDQNDFAFQRQAVIYDAPVRLDVRRVEVRHAPQVRFVEAPQKVRQVERVIEVRRQRGGGLAAIAAALRQRQQVQHVVEVRREFVRY